MNLSSLMARIGGAFRTAGGSSRLRVHRSVTTDWRTPPPEIRDAQESNQDINHTRLTDDTMPLSAPRSMPPPSMSLAAKLFHPSTIILLAANLLPLLGIAFWHWDAFLLLILYWMETAIIGFWTIMAIVAAPLETVGPAARGTSRLFIVSFFIVHASIFMGVHFMFLWDIFSGTWSREVHGAGDFIRVIVIETGLWVPLAALFVSRGFSFLVAVLGSRLLPSWLAPAQPDPGDSPFSETRLLGGFYSRIIVMHVTIIFGGFIAIAIGSVAPLIFLVVLKTWIDLKLHLRHDFPDAKARETPVAATQ